MVREIRVHEGGVSRERELNRVKLEIMELRNKSQSLLLWGSNINVVQYEWSI